MEKLIFYSANEAFEFFYDKILEEGYLTEVGTKALYDVGFVIARPTVRDITTPWRKWSKDYANREWQWYLSGNPSVEGIKKYASTWDKMHSGDNIVNSNYGFQWQRNNQLAKCIEQLKNNENTRQAWISIFDGKEKDKYSYDTPCTMSIGFDIKPLNSNHLIKEKVLDMTVLMRSNDLIYGFCNDQYCFSMLQEFVANELGIKPGIYYHFVHDLHIYSKHWTLKDKYYKLKTKITSNEDEN